MPSPTRETTTHDAEAPPEWSERLAALPAAWFAARPRVAEVLRRVRAISLWVALPVAGAMLVLVPSTRGSVRAYAWSFALLVVWFLLVRTRTVTWAGTARMFTACLAWSAVIGWFTLRVDAVLGLSASSEGSATALAGFLEESGKLVPLLVLAVLAPGRVRRFAAGDWAVLGFASGVAFNAYEDAMRQIAVQRSWFVWEDPARAYSLNPWAAGQFVSPDGVALSPGHHIWTVVGAMGIGLGIALWRTRRTPLRVAAFALPAVLILWQVADHASFNAHNYQSSWPQVPAPGFPVVLSGMWSLGGHGRFLSVASALLLVVCLLVDTHRRHQAAVLAPVGPNRPRPGGAVNDTEPGLPLLRWWTTTLTPHATATPGARARAAQVALPVGTAVIRALAQWVADLGVAVAAHAPQPGEHRTAALLRGRTITVRVRQIRAEAMDLTTPGTEPAARRRFALLAAVLGTLAVAVCVVWGAHMATAIGTYLQLDGDGPYLAGLLDNVGDWWNGLNGWQKLAVGAGVAALVVLSGGSLGLALGISGVATYGLAHAHGAASLTRDPVAATRSYVATTSPGEGLLDIGEFALTFLPGNFAGAAAGRGLRVIAKELVDNPALFVERLRSGMRGDAGVLNLSAVDDALVATKISLYKRLAEAPWMPEYARPMFRGSVFNWENYARYDANEVLVEVVRTPEQIAARVKATRFRLDSYNLGTDIVSRKLTQLADVTESTAKSYLSDLANQFGSRSASVITDTPANRVQLGHLEGVIGRPLRGRLVLEVPVQAQAVPDAILEHAAQLNIDIQDITGTVYEALGGAL